MTSCKVLTTCVDTASMNKDQERDKAREQAKRTVGGEYLHICQAVNNKTRGQWRCVHVKRGIGMREVGENSLIQIKSARMHPKIHERLTCMIELNY